MMTTDLITFFHPDGSTGKDWTFSLQLEDGSMTDVWVFDRGGEADFSRFAAARVFSMEEINRVPDEIHALIQPRGGIYLCVWNHNGVTRSKLVKVEVPGYAPPKRMLRLSPAAGSGFEDITGKADFAASDHLVIPVSATAEKRLQAFCEELDGFPADLQSSILNVIRRPSLEWRIHRIERTLSLPPATRAEQQKERARRSGFLGFLEKLRSAVMRPIPIGPAIAALLLLTSTVAAYERYVGRRERAVEDKTVEEKADPQAKKSSIEVVVDPPVDTSEKDSSPEHPLEDSLHTLDSALKKSENRSIKKLYITHFARQSANSPTRGWGMAKLQALQRGFIGLSDPILDSSYNPTAVSDLYKQTVLSAIKKDNDALALLAWSCCHYFGATSLKATRTRPALPLGVEGDCKDLKFEDAEPALRTLTEWVEQQN